jgi:hypothetical protein
MNKIGAWDNNDKSVKERLRKSKQKMPPCLTLEQRSTPKQLFCSLFPVFFPIMAR